MAEDAPSGDGRILTVVVERLAPEPAVRCEGWCTAEEAFLVLPMPDGGKQTLSAPAAELVVHLGALVGLGPRPDPAPDGLPPRVGFRWRIETLWNGPGGQPASRTLAAVDGGDAGWWVVDPDGVSRPTSATQLFRGLCRLVPMDTELG